MTSGHLDNGRNHGLMIARSCAHCVRFPSGP
jgi:hypothetical protein